MKLLTFKFWLVVILTAALAITVKIYAWQLLRADIAPITFSPISQFHRDFFSSGKNDGQLWFSRGAIRLNVNLNIKKDEMAQELAEIPQLYMERPAPYAGLVSNTVGCSKKYLPKPIHLVSPHAKIDGYELFANSHMIFGACTEQNAVYHSFILRIECRYGNEISKIAVYSPAEVDFSEMQKWPQLVDCD